MTSIDTTFPDFDGKTVVFYIGVERRTATIRSPKCEMRGDRLFLVGEAETSPGHWAEGALAAVAWESVSSYLCFDEAEWPAKRDKIDIARRSRERNKKSFWPWNSES